jgi:cytochrome c
MTSSTRRQGSNRIRSLSAVLRRRMFADSCGSPNSMDSVPSRTRPGSVLAVRSAVAVIVAALIVSTASAEEQQKNAVPLVTIHTGANKMFFWPDQPIDYQIVVSDAEGRDTLAGTIDPHRVAVAFDHVEEFSKTFAPPVVNGDLLARLGPGKELVARSNCPICHTVEGGTRRIPTFKAIAERFKGADTAADYLATKIISGGSGSWITDGTALMPPHPEFTPAEGRALALYILALGNPEARKNWLPIRGTVTPTSDATEAAKTQERYVLWASYTDQSVKGTEKKTGIAVVAWRPALLSVTERTGTDGVEPVSLPKLGLALVGVQPRGFIQFTGIDLTDVRQLVFVVSDLASVWAGGRIELRIDDILSEPLGQTAFMPRSNKPSLVDVPISIPATPGRHDLFVYLRGLRGEKKGTIALTSIKFLR